ncbi:hypothetical protein WN943_007603 [Citrus x changshan-huyou]
MLFANFHERVCQRLDIEKQFQWAKEGVYIYVNTNYGLRKAFLAQAFMFSYDTRHFSDIMTKKKTWNTPPNRTDNIHQAKK